VKLERKIGLFAGVGIVTGGVIGMGAYALIPGISANAGEGAWLAIMLALIVSLIGVLPLIQISSALPVAGAGYAYCSRLISPFAGLLVSSLAIMGGSSSLCLVALGLAQYYLEYFPANIDAFTVAAIFILLFYFVYQFGLKLLAALQIAMGIQMLLALIMYAIILLQKNNFEIVAGSPSEGFWFAVILAFNVSFGFQIIIELGEEIRKPERNIPLALIIGAGVVMIIYLAILSGYLSEVGVEGAKLKPSLASTAQPYFNSFLNFFFILGVMNAGITSYNAGAIALPREIFAMARDRMLPSFLSGINATNGNPGKAVNMFFVIVLLILFLGKILHTSGLIARHFGPKVDDVIEFYGFLTILGIMMLTVFISIAAFRLPKLYPVQYTNAYFRFPRWLLNVFIIISILSSVVLIAIMSTKVIVVIIYLLYTFVVAIYYFLRKKHLKSKGLQIGKVYDVFSENKTD
jgi:basic amino acid/polyamine antiporter, APA family